MSHQLNEAKRFWAIIYTQSTWIATISLIAFIYLSVVFAIPTRSIELANNFCIFIWLWAHSHFDGYCDKTRRFGKFNRDSISNLSNLKFVVNAQLVATYGFDRCSQNQTSKTLLDLRYQ